MSYLNAHKTLEILTSQGNNEAIFRPVWFYHQNVAWAKERKRETGQKKHNFFPLRIFIELNLSSVWLNEGQFELLMQYRTFPIKYFCCFYVECRLIFRSCCPMRGNKNRMNCRYYRIWKQRDCVRNGGILDSKSTIIHVRKLTTHNNISCNVSFVDAIIRSPVRLAGVELNERVRAVRTLFTLCTSVNMLIIPPKQTVRIHWHSHR